MQVEADNCCRHPRGKEGAGVRLPAELEFQLISDTMWLVVKAKKIVSVEVFAISNWGIIIEFLPL